MIEYFQSEYTYEDGIYFVLSTCPFPCLCLPSNCCRSNICPTEHFYCNYYKTRNPRRNLSGSGLNLETDLMHKWTVPLRVFNKKGNECSRAIPRMVWITKYETVGTIGVYLVYDMKKGLSRSLIGSSVFG